MGAKKRYSTGKVERKESEEKPQNLLLRCTIHYCHIS